MTAYLLEGNIRNQIIRKFTFPEREDFIKEIKNTCPDAITDKFELMRYIQNNPKRGNYLDIKSKMINLENALSKRYNTSVDPVVYIISLYFREELSIRDISARIALFGVNIPRNTLNNMLVNVFSWTLRAHNEITKVTEKKNKVKPNEFNNARTISIQTTNKILLENILNGRKEVDMGRYEMCKNHSQRVAYVLNVFSLAENEKESQFYIKNLQKNGSSMESISYILTTLFNNLFSQYPEAKIPKLKGSEINKMYFR